MKFFSKLLQTDAYRIKELDKMAGRMAGIAIEYESKQQLLNVTAREMTNASADSEVFRMGSEILQNAISGKHELEERIEKMSAKMQRLVDGIKDPGARVSAEVIVNKIKERIPTEVKNRMATSLEVEPMQKISRKL